MEEEQFKQTNEANVLSSDITEHQKNRFVNNRILIHQDCEF